MKVEGNVDLLKQNMKYYMKVSNEGKDIPFEKLYNTFFNQFMKDEIERIIIQNKSEMESSITEENNLGFIESDNLEKENIFSEIENELENIENENLEIESTESEIENVTVSPSMFLNMVSNLSKQEESSSEEIEEAEEVEEIIHGIFIDEWQPVILEEYIPKPLYEEDKEVETQNVTKEVIHGIFIDEWVSTETKVTEYYFNNEDDLDDILDSILSEINSESQQNEDELEESKSEDINENFFEEESIDDIKGFFEEDDNTIENSESIDDIKGFFEEDNNTTENSESKKNSEEVVVVPTNIRDFIKSHQGAEVSFVLKYYKKKDLEKAVSLGKIYKKQGRLYV